MISDIRDLLPLYALGLLEPDLADVVERAVRRDPALAAELRQYDLAADRLLDHAATLAPPPTLRDRLIASTGGGRFERFVERVGAMYDVTVDRARELLALIEDPSTHDRELPGCALVHFTPGPAYAGADCGFLVITAGGEFPWHRHEGEEVGLIMQGTMIDCDGTVLGPGDVDHKPAGSEHSFRAGEGDDLVFCARVWGVRFDVARPG